MAESWILRGGFELSAKSYLLWWSHLRSRPSHSLEFFVTNEQRTHERTNNWGRTLWRPHVAADHQVLREKVQQRPPTIRRAGIDCAHRRGSQTTWGAATTFLNISFPHCPAPLKKRAVALTLRSRSANKWFWRQGKQSIPTWVLSLGGGFEKFC